MNHHHYYLLSVLLTGVLLAAGACRSDKQVVRSNVATDSSFTATQSLRFGRAAADSFDWHGSLRIDSVRIHMRQDTGNVRRSSRIELFGVERREKAAAVSRAGEERTDSTSVSIAVRRAEKSESVTSQAAGRGYRRWIMLAVTAVCGIVAGWRLGRFFSRK